MWQLRHAAWSVLLFTAGCVELPAPTTPGATVDTAWTGQVPACDGRELSGTCSEFVGDGWEEPRGTVVWCVPPEVALDACPPSDLGGCDQRPEGAMVWFYIGDRYDLADQDGRRRWCEEHGWTWIDP